MTTDAERACLGYLRMVQRTNEVVWATVAAVVCGIVLASLLTGSGLPLLAIGVVVAAGATLAVLRRRRFSPYEESSRRRIGRFERRSRETRPEQSRSPAATRSQPRRPEPILGEPWSRRAGIRSKSLGASQDDDNRGSR